MSKESKRDHEFELPWNTLWNKRVIFIFAVFKFILKLGTVSHFFKSVTLSSSYEDYGI